MGASSSADGAANAHDIELTSEYAPVSTSEQTAMEEVLSARAALQDPNTTNNGSNANKNKFRVLQWAFLLVTQATCLVLVATVIWGHRAAISAAALDAFSTVEEAAETYAGKDDTNPSAWHLSYAHVPAAASYCFHLESRPLPKALQHGLGSTNITVSSNNQEAVQYCRHGFQQFYGFNGEEAVVYFRKALSLDKNMALAYYGIALTVGANINFHIDPLCENFALQYVQKALQLSTEGSSGVERALIAALAVRYRNTTNPITKSHVGAEYANAMKSVYDLFLPASVGFASSAAAPDSNKNTAGSSTAILAAAAISSSSSAAEGSQSFPDIVSVYVDSMMDVCTQGLYFANGSTRCPLRDEIVRVLDAAIAAYPEHLGLHHYYIHALEGSPTPQRALRSAKVIGALAPQNGHTVHMAAHIYFRLGMYADAIEASVNAIGADKVYRERCRADVYSPQCDLIYTGHYHPHNVAMLLWSYLMSGQGQLAVSTARKLIPHVTKYMQVLRNMEHDTTNYFVALDVFSRWDEALSATLYDGATAPAVALWHYVRAKAYLARDDHPNAHAEMALFEEGRANVTAAGSAAEARIFGGTSIIDLLTLGSLELLAKHAFMEGDVQPAISYLKQGITLQDLLTYNEPIAWLPLRARLGALLYANGDYSAALKVFNALLTGNSSSTSAPTTSGSTSGGAAAAGVTVDSFGTIPQNAYPGNAFGLLGVAECSRKLDLPYDMYYREFQHISNKDGLLTIETMF
jgi:tetratricopeptide (TPR) repeat protein